MPKDLGIKPDYGPSGKDGKNKLGFVHGENITLEGTIKKARCVRDIRVD